MDKHYEADPKQSWWSFDGADFLPFANPMPEEEGDWKKAMAAAGYGDQEWAYPDEFSEFEVIIFAGDKGFAVDLNNSNRGFGTVVCESLPAFYIFMAKYVEPLVRMSHGQRMFDVVTRMNETLLDDTDGLPAVQRVALRERRMREQYARERKARAKAPE